MTEKRFYIQCDEYNAWSVWEKNKEMIVFDLLQPDALIICNKLNELSDEKEQLKQALRDYHNAFDCSQCRYQNYNWYDDGDEFEVCDKGNNEAQMEYHSCKDWEEL